MSTSTAGYSPRAASEESSTVIVGMAPPLEDVVDGVSTEKPFDLDSFMAYAKTNFFVENLVFLTEVNKLRREPDVHRYKSSLLHIMAEFVEVNAPSQINLGENVRKETKRRVAAVLETIRQDPVAEPDRTSLDKAYKAILSLVSIDPYARYTALIVVQRQLRVATLDALWWTQEGMTVTKFFTFPSPVNSAESRLHACLAVLLVPTAAGLSWVIESHWLWVWVTYGYMARSLCGPRLDPQAFLVLFVLRPLVADKLGLLKNEFKAGSPKRFSQAVGLIFAAVSTALAFFGLRLAMLVVAALLFGASFLAAFCDICLACEFFMLAISANLVPQSACEDCRVRYIKGKGTPGSGGNTSKTKSKPASRNARSLKSISEDIEGEMGSVGRQVCSRSAVPATEV